MAPLVEAGGGRHDFGTLIARTGTVVRHAYRLTNRSDRPLVIARVVNHLSCCSTLELSRDHLQPGESAELSLAIRVAGRFGDFSHTATIEANPPASSPMVLQSRAVLYPPARIDEITPSVPDPETRTFRVETCGTAEDPPLDLDGARLRSGLPATWEGESVRVVDPTGIRRFLRTFRVRLDRSGEAGARRESVALLDGTATVCEQAITWEVLPRIQVSPPAIPWRPDRDTYSLILKSTDGFSFRVIGLESDWAEVRREAEETGASLTHALKLRVRRNQARAGNGVMFLLTDHPERPRIRVPILCLD